MLAAPVLERLRFFESITPDPNISTEEICERLDLRDDDLPRLAQFVGYLIPPDRLFEVCAGMSGIHSIGISENLHSFRASAALREIKKDTSPFLFEAISALHREWHDGDQAPVMSVMPRVASLADHPDPLVADAAALFALKAKTLSPPVISALRRRLRSLPALLERRKAGDDEVGELGRSELFWGIAKAGGELRDLASDFLLHEDNGLHAAVAAVGVKAHRLRPDIEKLYACKPAPPEDMQSIKAFPILHARSFYAYAIWYLGGSDDLFDEAASYATNNFMLRRRLVELFQVSAPDTRVLQSLSRLATEHMWQEDILESFGVFGPAAASFVSAIARPVLAEKACISHIKTCWLCGITDSTETRRAVEQKLASHHWATMSDDDNGLAESWQLYLQLDPDAGHIRTALEALDPENPYPLAELANPRRGLRFLPIIHQTGHHALVEALWRRSLDKSSFWSSLKS